MSYIEQINRAIDYIEDNLCGRLDLEVIAKRAGLSKWHFQRIFRAMVGDTVKEYVAKRRLSLAAMALVGSEQKVIDIALAHEFESHEVFIRAFKRAFGTTPSEFRRSGAEPSRIPHKPKITWDYLNHLYGGLSMQPTILKLGRMTVIGMAEPIKTVHDPDFADNHEAIPVLWQKFRANFNAIPHRVKGQKVGLIDQVAGETGSEKLEYVAGVVVEGSGKLPDGFVERVIPAGDYAEFLHRGPMSRIGHTMNYIYGSWLPKSGRERGEGPEVGVIPDGFDRNAADAEIRIWIPLKT